MASEKAMNAAREHDFPTVLAEELQNIADHGPGAAICDGDLDLAFKASVRRIVQKCLAAEKEARHGE